MKNKEEIRELAEEHWKYTEGVIQRIVTGKWTDVVLEKETLSLFKYVYVEALIHGFKHGKEDKE